MNTRKTAGTILKFENLKKSGRIIIGIDPGLRSLGIGIIELSENTDIQLKKMKKESIPAESLLKFVSGYAQIILQIKAQREIHEKLFFIFESLCEIIEEYDPVHILVEDAFVGVNKNSALKLGLARGSILTAIGKYKKPVEIISPKEIKMQVAGNGRAEKEEIEDFFSKHLENWRSVRHDASDALAAAFCGIKKFLHKEYL